MRRLALGFVLTLSSLPPAAVQSQQDISALLGEERPIEAANTIWIEEMTWMEIRDAIAGGTTTVIVSSGGIEQNGPYVAMGKHNYILNVHCEDIARRLGNTLCAPIIKYVPEGNLDGSSGHMRYSGTIGVRQETFRAVVHDVATSLASHGFTDVVFIGDSGGNQSGMEAVATELNAEWSHARAHFIGGFYDNDAVMAYLEQEFGITEEQPYWHDSYWNTALQMVDDPESVRYDERVAAGLAHINGVSIEPKDETIRIGKALTKFRVDRTVDMIRASMSGS